MAKAQKSHASGIAYISTSLLELAGFEFLFTEHDAGNRWVRLTR